MKPTTDQILLFLKTRGPGTTQAVAVLLGVSRQAARVHLEKLATQGLLASDTVPEGVGRPKQTWRLTDQGHSRFPDSHAQMTVELIEAIREEFGAPGLERLVVRREAVTAKSYEQALAGAAGLEARLERLTQIRVQEGYMASWHAEAEGSYLLIEDHCPICAAASACQGFCRSELSLFEMLLAPAKVERTEHLLAGGRRCSYRVTPVAKGLRLAAK